MPVFIWAPEEEGGWVPGGASRWWLHQSLKKLDSDLRELGSQLILRHGPSLTALNDLIRETGADTVYWNRRYEPTIISRDKSIKEALQVESIEAKSFNGSLLFEPWEIQTKQNKPYQVFTPFWKTCLGQNREHELLPTPQQLESIPQDIASCDLREFSLEPKTPWDLGLREHCRVGSEAAHERLHTFLAEHVGGYKDQRNFMDRVCTSGLSPHLHFGEISPREVWAETQVAMAKQPEFQKGADCFLSEIGWREFGYHLLYHFPKTTNVALRDNFKGFPWDVDTKKLKRWQRGATGIPIVDAAMRELWTTGIMHNRARMIVASFLTKHLLQPWQSGTEWFWDTLVDADLASNTLGWQWSAGCGADAAPYFRVFNPVTQAQKFDPAGAYIRRWVPELCQLELPHLYLPSQAPEEVLQTAGITLGTTYPYPIVDLAEGRERALAAYEKIKKE